MPLGQGVVENFLTQAIIANGWRLRFFKTSVYRRDDDMRVSFSALLRLPHNGRYLLVRNLHQPETFGPFGGVYKYYNSATIRLNAFQFNPQVVGPSEDMYDDLRGFLPRKNVYGLYRWFEDEHDREPASDCLRRELEEELREVSLPKVLNVPRQMRFRRIWRVLEGPKKVPGVDYGQFRVFDVYDVENPREQKVQQFLTSLTGLARGNKDLLFATREDIQLGRSSNGSIVGHHCCYLLRKKATRPPTPSPFHIACRDTQEHLTDAPELLIVDEDGR